ncbi:MAG: site-specific integrase [Spirochaetota bacterium]
MRDLQNTRQTQVQALQMVGNPNYDTYIQQYQVYCEQMQLELGTKSLTEYLRYCKDIYAISSLGVIKAALKKSLKQSFFGTPRYYEFLSIIDHIFKDIKTGKQDKKIYSDEVISEEELQQLYLGKTLKNNASGKERKVCLSEKEQLLLQLLAETGMRISEALSIKLSDCSQHDARFTHIKIIGKGKKERRNIIPKSLFMDICAEYNGTKYLFETAKFFKNGILDTEAYRQNFKNRLSYYSKQVLGKKITPHDFRHYFATKWLKKGKSVKAIASWLGHSTTAITNDMYIHIELSPEELFA